MEMGLGTAIGIVAGFGLAVAWDIFKARRDRGRRQHSALRNLCREMAGNRRVCSSNLTMLGVEERDRAKRESKGHLNPLERLETGAWSLAYLDLPSALVSDEDLVNRLEVLVSIARRIDNTIESREHFRIQHVVGADTFYLNVMAGYANILRHPQEDLIVRIDEAQRELLPQIAPGSGLLKSWLQKIAGLRSGRGSVSAS
jgi:hypothetical protein